MSELHNENGNGTQAPSDDLAGFAGDDHVTDTRLYKKTITPASIDSLPERAKTLRRPVLLFRITGFLRGEAVEFSAADPKQERPFYALVGDIVAQVYNDDGATIRDEHAAPQCYLPGGWHDQTLSMVRNMTEFGISQVPIDWEFASAPATNPRGYRWLARNLLQIPRDNPLTRLIARGDRIRQAHELPDFRSEQRALPGTGETIENAPA